MDVKTKRSISVCPVCGSGRIIEISQAVLIKMRNVNTGKMLNPNTRKSYMSNREKASAYDNASSDGIGCWYHECRRCGWKSDIYIE